MFINTLVIIKRLLFIGGMEGIIITMSRTQLRKITKIIGALSLTTLGFAGCSGGAATFGDANDLWEAVEESIACGPSDLYVEHKEASGEVPAYGEAVCQDGDIGDGVRIAFDSLVVQDNETLMAFIENDNMHPSLKGENWTITVEADESTQQEFVNRWLEELQSDIGGELQPTE